MIPTTYTELTNILEAIPHENAAEAARTGWLLTLAEALEDAGFGGEAEEIRERALKIILVSAARIGGKQP